MTTGPSALGQIRTILKDVPPEHRLVLTTAIDGMDDILRQLIERENFKIACLGYDVEGWELTPDDERSDPVAACKRGQELAHKYGLKFLVCPTRAIGEKWGLQMAPYADLMKVQNKGTQAQKRREWFIRRQRFAIEPVIPHPLPVVAIGRLVAFQHVV